MREKQGDPILVKLKATFPESSDTTGKNKGEDCAIKKAPCTYQRCGYQKEEKFLQKQLDHIIFLKADGF